MDTTQTSEKEIITPNRNSSLEKQARLKLAQLFAQCPIPKEEVLTHLAVFMPRKIVSSILSLAEIYKMIINVHGDVFDLGTRWGTNMVNFANFRGIFEPYNANRRLIAFDTFEGLKGGGSKDHGAEFATDGILSVSQDYEVFLDKVMSCHETLSPISHIKRYEIIKGDAVITVKKYLEDHPETIIALAYFDFDIYQPTKECLEIIKKRLTKGSVICFDQLNYPLFPGETVALREVFGLDRYAIRRLPNISTAFIIIE